MAITFDNENSSLQAVTSTIILAYTGASGSSLLLNGYYQDAATGITATATYNAAPLALGQNVTRTLGATTIYAVQFYGVGVCDGSSHDIVMTLSASVISVRINPQSWNGVGSFNAPDTRATGASTSPTTVAISSATGEIVVDAVIWTDAALSTTATYPDTDPADPTNVLIRQSDNSASRCGSHYQNGAASITMHCTLSTSQDWATVALALQPSVASEPYELEAGRHFISGFNAVP